MATRWLLIPICILVTACAAQLTSPIATTEPAPTATTFIAEYIETAISIATPTVANPGPGSAVVSPIHIHLNPVAVVTRVDLRDLDGVLLARQLVVSGESEAWLPFEVEAATPALLVLSVEDEYGRLMSVNSFEVQLLPDGESQLEAENSQPTIEFSAPQESMQIDGDSVRVYVFVDSEDGRAYNIRMITREGRVVANRDVYSEDGIVQAEIAANIDEATFVRVVVSRSIGGAIIQLSSIEVELVP